MLTDFAAYSQLLGRFQDILAGLSLEGELQNASLPLRHCFTDADEYDVGNYTNRSPYPRLHLLREASVAEAITDHADPAGIP